MIRLWLRTVLLGATAGLAAFLLDLGLAVLAVGYGLPLRPHYLLAYLALGGLVAVVLALLVTAARCLSRSDLPSLPGPASPGLGSRSLFAWTLALLYLPAIYERIHQAVAFRVSGRTALWATLAAVAAGTAYLLWAWVLARTARPGAPTAYTAYTAPTAHISQAPSFPPWGPLLAALTAALGLAINRSLVDRPTEPRALVADAAVVAGLWLVAWLTRRWDWRPVAVAGAAILAAGLSLHLGNGSASSESAPSERTSDRPSPSRATDPPTNLVLVIVDTLRQDVFRDVLETTAEGRRFHAALPGTAWFDHAIAAAPWTAPSVGSIHTGLYPVEHGYGSRALRRMHQLPRLDGAALTLAQFLGNRGYQTVGVVTNALLHPDSGIARGFQKYEVLQAGTHKLPILHALVQAGWVRHELYQPADLARRYLQHRMGPGGWLDPQRPYFVWLHLMDPHAPLHPHPELPPDPRANDLPEMDRLYREETRFALQELATFFEGLAQDAATWDRTLVVVVADHGEMFPSDRHFNGVYQDGERKVSGHGHAHYEELVRIPLGIRPPGGLQRERRIEAIVSHVDLFGTLVDLLGLERPARLKNDLAADVGPGPGNRLTSFAAWIADANGEPNGEPHGPEVAGGRDFALSSMNQHGPPNRALRTATRKLIHYPEGQRPDELYDLVADPRERRNLVAKAPDAVAADVAAEVAAAIALQELFWSRLTPAATTEAMELDAETRRKLEALGYL